MQYNPESVGKAFERTVSQLELPRIRLHDLRHTWASLALEAGVHIRVVADRLGHSSPTVTLNVYSHSTPKLDRAAAEAVSQMVGRG
jgi:integrase